MHIEKEWMDDEIEVEFGELERLNVGSKEIREEDEEDFFKV